MLYESCIMKARDLFVYYIHHQHAGLVIDEFDQG
ncbi:hypothetical protein CASFOL_041983 [Castilleja foliolosa]|uniref:Uncharacterized protein n=1 Tax=Castilleja foliolosa TaxID=1961234 RepID=A0ABD3B9V1_9LAMI